MSITSPRGLVIQLLGELLYVERRLADEILPATRDSIADEPLRKALGAHRDETLTHVERLETAFRRLEVAPTSNRVAELESAVAHGRELADLVVGRELRDVAHAQTALRLEHWELGSYRSVLALVPREIAELLEPSIEDEQHAADSLAAAIVRLAQDARRVS